MKKLVKNVTQYKLWLACGLFIFFSFLFAFETQIISFSKHKEFQYFIQTVLECLWWFSLYFLANQIINYFIWNKWLLQSGVIVPRIFKNLVSLVFLILTVAAIVHFVFAKSVFGIFTASGIMAIILGYSAQATLSDVFAGIGLNTTKQFSDGDWITVYGGAGAGRSVTGKVLDINWRFVNLLSYDGNILSIPNSVISQQIIENLSQPNPVHSGTLSVTVKQLISPERFKNILVSVALQSDKVLAEPKPIATLMELREEDSLYQLVYSTKEISTTMINDQILSALWYRCLREDIILVGSELPPKPTLSHKELASFLRKVDLFHCLQKEEIQSLAEHCHYRMYGPPERVLVEGESNQSLYVIYRGSVSLFINTKTNNPVLFESYQEGDYFGEISLLTGALCRGSIVVKTESIIIEIDHDNIGALFANRPELMEKISALVVKRVSAIEHLQHAQVKIPEADHQNLLRTLVSHVRHFFKHKNVPF
ncbi:mechanosensitive ion channel family protein [Legionella lansingensis]|uniref:mechanosensitive ion channel family protein n=1 Tax=Legionella lansingensis TaxID=45067 RepID=UPI001A942892|nr:mechanosensitive ion channel family protein [Legionella lansingensis]